MTPEEAAGFYENGGALGDFETSSDAMRWVPDGEREPEPAEGAVAAQIRQSLDYIRTTYGPGAAL